MFPADLRSRAFIAACHENCARIPDDVMLWASYHRIRLISAVLPDIRTIHVSCPHTSTGYDGQP